MSDRPPVISQTMYMFTVLHRTDSPPKDIEDALEESRTGHMVGAVTAQVTDYVSDNKVAHELRLLGNEGTFFDEDLGENLSRE